MEISPPPAATFRRTSKSWQSRWFNFVLWAAILTLFTIFLRAVEPILLPFVVGILVAYLMNPIVTRLEGRRLGRSAATAMVLVSFIAILAALVTWLLPIVYKQISALATRAPEQIRALELALHDKASPFLQNLNSLTGGTDPAAIPSDTGVLVERLLQSSSQLAGQLFSSGAAFINVMALLLITPIVCFYLIRDWPSMMRRVDELLPRAFAPTIREQLYLINRTLASYLRGQLLVMLIMSVFYVIGLWITGLNFALALGLLAGFVIIVPYVGSVISVGLGLFTAYAQFGVTGDFWMVLVVYGIGQVIESQILTPKIIGDRVGLHPLWMLFGMLAGAAILGFVGVLLAVPLTAVIGVLARFAVHRYLESGLYQG
jgi:predicted PurR-regulated permease PerM